MPELPEAEVVRAGLEPAVTGARVASITVFDERSLRRHDGSSEDFVQRLTDAAFIGASRRGKYMWLPIADSAEALVVHLGMSGQVLLRDRFTGVLRMMAATGMQGPPKRRDELAYQFPVIIAELLAPHRAELRVEPEQVAHYARVLAFASSLPVFGESIPFDAAEMLDLVQHGVVHGTEN